MKKGYMKCPFCANEIKEWAIKCQFCEEFLDWRNKKTSQNKWNKSKNLKKILIISLIIVIIIGLSLFVPTLLSKNGKNIREWWIEYNDWSISFRHPWDFVVSDEPFEDFTFFEPTNINVQIYNFNTLIEPIISEEWQTEEFFSDWHSENSWTFFDEKRKQYKRLLDKIKNWEDVDISEMFDHYSGFWTMGPYSVSKVNINWVNWLIIRYYFTQDPKMGCVTQFNTELLLVKNENAIYSIMFKNNFWWVYELVKSFEWESEACLYDTIKDEAENVSNKIEQYYRYWKTLQWTPYVVFEENDKIISDIIETVHLN